MDMQSAIDRAASRDRPAITAQERDRIVEMLRTLPIAEVKAKSRRSYLTLARMAEACL